jgi:hypothetical protein
VECIGAADIYVTPYRHEAQVVSGTLAFALGAGKAVISTPYWHAIELLDGGRGALVPFEDPAAIARKTVELLDTPAVRHAMRKRAYVYARDMVWKRVAQGYMKSFERARTDRMHAPRVAFADGTAAKCLDKLPALNLNHLRRLTDDTGMFQHAIFAVPNYAEGYTTDDNARALILAVQLERLRLEEPGSDQAVEAEGAGTGDLGARYLAFLGHAFNPENGRFRNFLSFERTWNEARGSEDSHGRALWALGTVLGRSKNSSLRGAAGRLFELAVPAVLAFGSPRAWAFALLGVHEYLDSFPGDRDAQKLGSVLASRLVEMYKRVRTPDWMWFENVVAYSNARLPQALLIAGQQTFDDETVSVGIESLNWLNKIQRSAGKDHYVPIGSQGFYRKEREKARFDQQPVEAAGAVSAGLEAYRATGDDRWRKEAWSAFNWFLGDNDLQIALYDPVTGGCRDGLHPERVNENQGAESTLSFLTALVEMRLAGEVENLQESPESLSASHDNAEPAHAL